MLFLVEICIVINGWEKTYNSLKREKEGENSIYPLLVGLYSERIHTHTHTHIFSCHTLSVIWELLCLLSKEYGGKMLTWWALMSRGGRGEGDNHTHKNTAFISTLWRDSVLRRNQILIRGLWNGLIKVIHLGLGCQVGAQDTPYRKYTSKKRE